MPDRGSLLRSLTVRSRLIHVPALDLLLGRPPVATQAEVALGPSQGVVIYWRDGCPFCARLRFTVRRYRDRALWLNVREDSDAAAFVRSTNENGYEVTPTVVIDGVAHTNPAPSLVLEALVR